MKIIKIIILICLFMIPFIKCRRNLNGYENRTELLKYINTEYGGCNMLRKSFQSSSLKSISNDTVYYSIKLDTLRISIGLNHICCVYFKIHQYQDNNNLYITLYDACKDTSISCYCTCECYYTFDVSFSNFKPNTDDYILNIYLWDAWYSKKSLIQQLLIK